MEDEPDIVTRLRVLNHHAKKLAENESLSDLHLDAFRRCEDLTWLAADEIERLRKERDEARKLYCEQMSVVSRQQDCTPQWFAEEHGWDRLYSKENLEET